MAEDSTCSTESLTPYPSEKEDFRLEALMILMIGVIDQTKGGHNQFGG